MDHNSGRVAFESSRHVLSLGGFNPPERPIASVNIGLEIRAGYVLDLRPPHESESEATSVVDVTPIAAPEVQHELSGPARQAVDRVPEPEPASYQPSSRWSAAAVPVLPEPEPERLPDAFDLALAKRDHDRRRR
jgi:hypothetical protein